MFRDILTFLELYYKKELNNSLPYLLMRTHKLIVYLSPICLDRGLIIHSRLFLASTLPPLAASSY